MKISTAVTINGHVVELVGNVSKSIRLFQLDDCYGSDLFLVDRADNVMGNIRVKSGDDFEIIIKDADGKDE